MTQLIGERPKQKNSIVHLGPLPMLTLNCCFTLLATIISFPLQQSETELLKHKDSLPKAVTPLIFWVHRILQPLLIRWFYFCLLGSAHLTFHLELKFQPLISQTSFLHLRHRLPHPPPFITASDPLLRLMRGSVVWRSDTSAPFMDLSCRIPFLYTKKNFDSPTMKEVRAEESKASGSNIFRE